jgi:hypothetical protein
MAGGSRGLSGGQVSTEKYEVHNGDVSSVVVNGEYKNSRRVPRIGQRKRLGLNGLKTNLVLLKLVVHRCGIYDENRRLWFKFTTEETWGGYYDF